ncbi:MAG: DUF3047 domain-containing protein [Pseudomonadota bacterium]
MTGSAVGEVQERAGPTMWWRWRRPGSSRWVSITAGLVAVVAALACAGCATRGGGGEDTSAPSQAVATPDMDVSSVLGNGWQPYTLPGKRHTSYRLSTVDGLPAVRADAQRSASMLRCKVNLAPQALGTLRFSWWVPRLMSQARLREAALEDAPVRLVLAFDGDHSKLSARNRLLFDLAHTWMGEAPPYATLMYVWDTDAAVEDVILGGRSDRIRKIVVDSGPRRLRSWRWHERDVAADFRRAFGEDPGRLIGVALMSDSDNTANDIHAFYGPVHMPGLSVWP